MALCQVYLKTEISSPLTAGIQLSASIHLVSYNRVLIRSLPLLFSKEAALEQVPFLGSLALPELLTSLL